MNNVLISGQPETRRMGFTAIRTTSAEGVMTIALARPDKLNAFTSAMHAELREALADAESNEAVRCVVITGEGRAFSAGQDLTEDRVRDADGAVDFGARLERDYNPLVERIYAFPKVTIAALNGPAVGAAANVALACDILVAARSAYMQQVFARIALVPDAGGTWSLPRVVGAKRALALMLAADQVPAADLHAMGLVYKVFDDSEFHNEVMALARRFAAGPTMAYRLIKEAVRASEGNDLKTQLALEANLQRKAGASEDAREGVMAFHEKRAPRYKGR